MYESLPQKVTSFLENNVNYRPVADNILVLIYDDGQDTVAMGGKKFILLDDTSFDNLRSKTIDEKHPGIRPRWAMVVSTSPKAQNDFGLQVGDKVLCDSLKWSRGVRVDNEGRRVWRIPPEDILGKDDEGFEEDELVKIEEWVNTRYSLGEVQ